MKIVGLLGAKTGAKNKIALDFVKENLNTQGYDITILNPCEYPIEFVDGRPFTDYHPKFQDMITTILGADIIIIATPIYQASIPGMLKNILDFIPQKGFQNKKIGIIANGGSEKHFLVPEYQLKPVLSYLKAAVVDKYPFLLPSYFTEEKLTDPNSIRRIEELITRLLNK